MEEFSSRLYSGPLSQAAQKILAVLRTQSLHEARPFHSVSSNHRQRQSGLGRFYGSQREPWAQSSWSMSQEESRDRGTERPWPQPQTSYHNSSNQWQSSQTSAYYQPPQASSCSSSCWDSNLQREAEAIHQGSPIYSPRKYSETPMNQSSQSLSFSQREMSETATSSSHRDRNTLSHQIPESAFEHQAATWRNSIEEFRPSFTLSLSPDVDGTDEVLFPSTKQHNTHEENPASAFPPISSCFENIEETEKNMSGAQRERVRGGEFLQKYKLTSDIQERWKQPLPNEGGIVYQQPCSETINTGRIHLPTRQQTYYDAHVPMLMRNPVRETDTGQIPCIEYIVQNGALLKERGYPDVTLPDEKRSTNDMGGLQLNETNKNADPERNLLSTSMDTSFDCDAETNKLVEKEELDFKDRVNIFDIKDFQPSLESEEPSVGCHTEGQEKIFSSEREDHKVIQDENTQDMGQIVIETGERHQSERLLEQCETTTLLQSDNLERTTEEEDAESRAKAGVNRSTGDKIKIEQLCCSDVQLRGKHWESYHREVSELSGGDTESEDRGRDGDESVLPHEDGEEASGRESCSTPTLSQESRAERSGLSAPCLHDNKQTANGGLSGSSSSVVLTPASIYAAGQSSSSVLDLASTVLKPSTEQAESSQPAFKTQPPLIPSFALKWKHKVHHQEKAHQPPKIYLPRRHPKWEPPRSSQEKARDIHGLKEAKVKTENPELTATSIHLQNTISQSHKSRRGHQDPCALKQSQQKAEKKCCESDSATCKPPKSKRAKREPDQGKNRTKVSHAQANGIELQNQSKAGCLTTSLTSDPRVKDSGRMNSEEKRQMLEEAGKAKALVLTLVYRDGTTQLDPEQKTTPPVCGLLLLMMNNLSCSSPENSFGPNDSLVYLKLEHTPAWAQQHTHQSQALFARDMLLQVLSRSQLVVCYKAKDLLRTALQVYRGDLSWKQVAGCRIQDPQVSGWLLDPANPSSCYNDLLNKHCKTRCVIPALGTKMVSQVISRLCLLHWLNMELCSKLQSRGLWQLYSDMELKMISVLAAMESHRIHVDEEALRRTSDLLGTKMKQLEQDAHRAAGEIFLVTSSAQLRTVLFEKLCLHERCENKKLPKTVNKQQQSTSEAALLQLQDLHPLPKIILEYRQVHKIKSTFVDGILSCMMSKNYISSTWHQTSVVTGRISAKHPNFQALPRQPLQIIKKQHIQGKEEEVVTVHPRAMFIPQDGWTFLSADFCQVELRLLAHLSCDPELLRVFTNPRADVFAMLASQWKGVSEGEVTSEDREHAKRIVYSVVYGAGRERLSGILGVSAEQATRFQDSFLQTYREVQTFIQKTIQQCHKRGYVLSIMGRRRTLPNINSPDWGIRMQAERQAVNFVVQGSAADLCKMAMIRIFNLVSSSSSLSARLLAQLHDELLFEVEDSQVEQFAALVKSVMESLQHIDQHGVRLKVPLKVAVSSGKSWGSMSELNIPPTSPSQAS